MTDKPCRWCRWYVPGWCSLADVPTGSDATCDEWEREPGADDDKEDGCTT